MKDYYSVFGLGRDADQEEIKRAYRRLARQYHPDVNPDDGSAEGKFKEAAEAYEVLSDPEKKGAATIISVSRGWGRWASEVTSRVSEPPLVIYSKCSSEGARGAAAGVRAAVTISSMRSRSPLRKLTGESNAR